MSTLALSGMYADGNDRFSCVGVLEVELASGTRSFLVTLSGPGPAPAPGTVVSLVHHTDDPDGLSIITQEDMGQI